MHIEKIMHHIRSGKKVNRRSWRHAYYVMLVENKLVLFDANDHECEWNQMPRDIMCDNWELVDEGYTPPHQRSSTHRKLCFNAFGGELYDPRATTGGKH